MDYQSTLNLPKTDFSMKAGLAQKEPELLKKWEETGLYSKIRQKSKGKKTFVLHDGPPYANGNIHIGHALNKILKDMIVKMKTMQGLDSPYVPGWDCHGLPIEHQLFKELKKKKGEVDSLEFRQKAHAYAMKYVGIQREQFKRLGVFGQWENPYLTLAPEYEYWILKALGQLMEKGYVYRGLKPVNWCAECETALAEAEVEYENHTSPSVYVKFQVKANSKFPEEIRKKVGDKPVYLLIWTTTPWTLLANVAVAVHPTYAYVFADIGAEVLIMESSLSVPALGKNGIADYKIWGEVDGRTLEGITYIHPFGIKDNCRVIVVDYVTKEDGTGLVHTAPGHGQADYEAGLAHNLDIVMPVDDRGIFTKEAGAFAGEYVFKANPKIIEDLRSRGILFAAQQITHSYPHCWRCKKPIIFRATKQWFLKIDHQGLRGKLKASIENQVQWIPPAGQERILGMVVTRPDWCLSRQRHWGVPIPAILCRGCRDEYKLFPTVINHFADMVRRGGTDLWFEKNIQELLPPGFQCPDCQQKNFEKTSDILDVWFDSGVSYKAVLGPLLQQNIPADMYLEGSDQHRGWFQSSLIPAVALEGRPPFAGVLTHGFVVDGQGRKMSKSLGNVISPEDVIKGQGVDILRLWVASSNYNEDVRLSKEILDRLVDAYRKIRNTVRYLLGNLDGYDPAQHQVEYGSLLELDRWALARLAENYETIRQAYNEYEFGKVYKGLYAFCNEELSSFYLDILKDRLYTSATFSSERRSAQTVLYHILNYLVRVLAPILTFTSEEIFAFMPKDAPTQAVSSVHLLEWPDVPKEWKNAAVQEKFKFLIALRPHVLKALEAKRREGTIGGSLEAKVIFKSAGEDEFKNLSLWQKALPSVFIVSQVYLEKVRSIQEGITDVLPQTEISVEPADGQKCSRCWNFNVHVGEDPQHPTLCDRCVVIVKQIMQGAA